MTYLETHRNYDLPASRDLDDENVDDTIASDFYDSIYKVAVATVDDGFYASEYYVFGNNADEALQTACEYHEAHMVEEEYMLEELGEIEYSVCRVLHTENMHRARIRRDAERTLDTITSKGIASYSMIVADCGPPNESYYEKEKLECVWECTPKDERFYGNAIGWAICQLENAGVTETSCRERTFNRDYLWFTNPCEDQGEHLKKQANESFEDGFDYNNLRKEVSYYLVNFSEEEEKKVNNALTESGVVKY